MVAIVTTQVLGVCHRGDVEVFPKAFWPKRKKKHIDFMQPQKTENPQSFYLHRAELILAVHCKSQFSVQFAVPLTLTTPFESKQNN